VSFLILAAEETSNPSPWPSIIFFGAIFAAMWFLILRPQRKRMRETQTVQRSLAVGDEVVLNTGVYGFITAFDTAEGTEIAWVDIAQVGNESVEIRVLKSSIARRIPATDEANETQ
jgi:preprotein translocase subunit YajC